jgi:hypothetical protein
VLATALLTSRQNNAPCTHRQILTRSPTTTVKVSNVTTTSVYTIELSVDESLGAEAYSLSGSSARVTVSGGDIRGVLYGVGKFLRTSTFQGKFIFTFSLCTRCL